MYDILNYVSGFIWGPFTLILILGTGIFLSLGLKGFTLTYIAVAFKQLFSKEEDSSSGEISSFQSLTTALSATVGTGNIAGVATAIFVGGPGAIFWMWVSAVFGMATKFAEAFLAIKYREKNELGETIGGPMYYIEQGLNLKWVAVLFSLLMMVTAIGSGNMPQINNIANVMDTEFNVPKLFTGLFLGVLLWIIIIGGITRIAAVASRIIPIMGLIYFGGALIILIENYQNIIPSFNSIFSQVFSGSAATGGFLGATFAMSLKYGVARGLYSNEAGQGSSPIAHASSKTEKSIEQGIVSILEPFIDTIVVCSVTALVILSSGVWTEKFENDFDRSSMVFIDGSYSENIESELNELARFVQNESSTIVRFSGEIKVINGEMIPSGFTLIHKRSIAENVLIYDDQDLLFNGTFSVSDGFLEDRLRFRGLSLIDSAELTAKAFSQGVLGESGGKLVAIALLLFAFSTAIAWCYYGDRSTAYIFGERGVFWYRNIYVVFFMLAAVIDTAIVWNIAYVSVALVAIPNLIALFVLRKEMYSLSNEFDKSR